VVARASAGGAASRATTPRQRAWDRLGRPFEWAVLDRTFSIAARLERPASDLGVNGDLHAKLVVRGRRNPWLAVEPVLLRGDIEYDLARVLWTRVHQMSGHADVRRQFDTGCCSERWTTGSGAWTTRPDHRPGTLPSDPQPTA